MEMAMRPAVRLEPDGAQERLEGLLVAVVGDLGIWAALRELRAGMRAVSVAGVVRTAFFTALDGDGLIVPPYDPRALVLILGYRRGAPAPSLVAL